LKNDLLSKLLFDRSDVSFDYFMIDQDKVQTGNYNKDAITGDLAAMVYANSTSTVESIALKKEEIGKNYKVEEFTDTNGKKVEFISYNVENDK